MSVDADDLACTYCHADLDPDDSFQLIASKERDVDAKEGIVRQSIRIVCGDCSIRAMDRVLAPEVDVSEVLEK